MHILFITADRRYLDEGSEQRELLGMMSSVTESLHVVVFTMKSHGYVDQKIGEHTWLYPTNSSFLFMQYFDGLSVIRHQVMWQDELHADVILSDDPKVAGWLGLRIASVYSRVWMVNLHDFYWDYEKLVSKLFWRYTVIPLKDLFANAFRIIAFSERVALYTQSATTVEEEKAKVVIFPEIYSTRSVVATDIKVKHPEFNFIILTYLPHSTEKLALAVQSMMWLHRSYQRCGLVVMTDRKPTASMLSEVARQQATDWVRFEVIEPESLPFSNANVFLYLNGGEEEDTILIRVASVGSLPIVAVQSVVSEKVLNNTASGLIIFESKPDIIANGIRKLNEIPGLRELFRVNAGLLHKQQALPSREELTQKLHEYYTFAYEEKPSDVPGPEKHLFANLTKKLTLLERVLVRLNRIKNKYSKL